MFGSGAVTGILVLLAAVLRQILQVLLLALGVCIVAVAGPTMLQAAAVLIAASPPRPTGAPTTGSVSPYSEFFPKKARK